MNQGSARIAAINGFHSFIALFRKSLASINSIQFSSTQSISSARMSPDTVHGIKKNKREGNIHSTSAKTAH